jgi:hypothetical protein
VDLLAIFGPEHEVYTIRARGALCWTRVLGRCRVANMLSEAGGLKFKPRPMQLSRKL